MFKLGDDIKSKKRKVEFDKGRHHRAKLGFILMSTDLAAEADFFEVIPKDVAIHITRLKTDDYTSNETLTRHIDYMAEAASRLQPDVKPDVISYHCTSGSIIIGEDRIKNEINKSKPEALVTTPITAALKAFRKLNLNKIAVLTPYPKNVNSTVFNYLIQNNIDIDSFHSFNLNYDSEIAQVDSDNLLDNIAKIDLQKVDGLFVSCTALKIVDILDQVEKKFSTTVVSSNQAIIWDSLKLANIHADIQGYGKLFVS